MFYYENKEFSANVGVLAGSVSGQYAEPVAVVEVWGRLMWVEVGRVLFTDCPNKEEKQ